MAGHIPGRASISKEAGRITTAPRPGKVISWRGASRHFALFQHLCRATLGDFVLYDQLCAWENLLLAYRRASKGKRGQPNVAAFEYHLEDNLCRLQEELLTQSYSPGDYCSFYIHEPKRRLISAAPFRDRVVHHALCNCIEPLFERSFIQDSYANRIGKGTHRALNRAQGFSRRFKYVLQLDICQFFPSIDHAILREIIAQKIKDARVLWLIDCILKSGKGVLSEAYQMVYLTQMRLTVHDGSHPRPVTEGFTFLGFNNYPRNRRLKRRKGLYYRRKLRALMIAYANGEIPLEKITASVQGWVNHARYGNTVGLRKALLCTRLIVPSGRS